MSLVLSVPWCIVSLQRSKSVGVVALGLRFVPYSVVVLPTCYKSVQKINVVL